MAVQLDASLAVSCFGALLVFLSLYSEHILYLLLWAVELFLAVVVQLYFLLQWAVESFGCCVGAVCLWSV